MELSEANKIESSSGQVLCRKSDEELFYRLEARWVMAPLTKEGNLGRVSGPDRGGDPEVWEWWKSCEMVGMPFGKLCL